MRLEQRLAALFWHKSRKTWVEITADDAQNRANTSRPDMALLVQLGFASTKTVKTSWRVRVQTWAITDSGMQLARPWL